MKLFIKLALFSIAINLIGCANQGWIYYRQAMKCHFQDKGQECNEHYEEALEENPNLPGIRSSYGIHLIKQGDNTKGQALLEEENQKYPHSQIAVKTALTNKSPAQTQVAESTPVETEEAVQAEESTEEVSND